MIICGLKLTHDGCVAVVDNGRLLFSIEMEKRDNNPRYTGIKDGETIAEILSGEGVPLDAIDLFVVDGWGGFNPEALAIQPQLEVGDENNWLTVRNKGKEYRLPIAQYCERRVGGDILAYQPFEDLRIGDRTLQYRSYFHVAGHVLSAYCLSSFAQRREPSYVLVWDGGMYPQLYFVDPENSRIESLGPLFLLIGNVYTIFSQHFGPFKIKGNFAKDDLSVAGKVMAYIALGKVNRTWFDEFERIYNERYDTPMGFANIFACNFKESLDGTAYSEDDVLCSFHHYLSELLVSKLAKKIERTGRRSRNLCIAGGCALNIKWNQAIRSAGIADTVFVPPIPNDSGSAVGMACCPMFQESGGHHLDWNVYLGPRIANSDSLPGWNSRQVPIAELAQLLHEVGEPVVFLKGRSELGPRALGNRSILAPAWHPGMKDVLNRIKGREGYRPVAPICLEHRAPEVFRPGSPDPFMLFDHHVADAWRARVPAICHLDGTARLQTVSRNDDSELFELLERYEVLSKLPLLCNTSANLKGCGFFPDAASAMNWGGTNYVWCNGQLFERTDKFPIPELQQEPVTTLP
jgi:carbamoyltransferase